MRTACNSTILFVVTAMRARDVTWVGSVNQPVSQRRCHSADHGTSVTGRSLVFWTLCLRSQGSSVGIETKLGGWTTGVRSRAGAGDTLFSLPFRLALGHTQPSTQWVPRNLFPKVKWQYSENEQAAPSSGEVKNGGEWRGEMGMREKKL
jgi:hypothetical protein